VRDLPPMEAQHVYEIRKLTEVTRALSYAASLDEVFQMTVDRAADLLATDRSLLMVADDGGMLTVRSWCGVEDGLVRGFRAPLNEELGARIAALLAASPQTFLAVPLVVGGAIKGVLAVIRTGASRDASREEWLLSALADSAAVALEQTRLQDIGEFREQLIGIVGHDLRTPLGTILMGAQLLLTVEGLGERETELARKITASAGVATRLIEQLLDLTRSRLGGGIPIDPARVDLTEVLRQVIDETELTHPTRPLRVQVSGSLTGVWDRDRLYQVIENLVGNAVHHGEPRTPIDLCAVGGETGVEISITNRGVPIPPAVLPSIFQAFRKARTLRATRSSGLGLGLFIAQQIAYAHGGSITVTSSENEGTTFVVRLPRVPGSDTGRLAE
jgi:sigma-B regulation protein RsbU (phosphoserine phosphatase)